MMPKRLAETPPGQQIKEQIGSGPFKFVQAEFQPGVKAVYEKNNDYVPRKEPPSWTAGAKVVKVDRVEWITMADAQTAVNALQSGDIDFIEAPSFDILPVLAANPDIKVETLNKAGFQTGGRMNFLYPPFDNVKVRRAAFMAMNQKDVLDALVGNPEYYKICGALFICGTPLATDVGSETLVKGDGMAAAKKLLAESGYDGTPVVIMAPGDVVSLKAQPIVAAQLLREAGFKVDVQATDWQIGGFAPRQPEAAEGGRLEHVLHQLQQLRCVEPVASTTDQRQGQERRLVRLAGGRQDGSSCKDAFARSSSPEEQKKIAADIQKEVYDQVIVIPLGQFLLAERMAEIADRRARRPGNAGVLEYRQGGMNWPVVRVEPTGRAKCAPDEQAPRNLPPH